MTRELARNSASRLDSVIDAWGSSETHIPNDVDLTRLGISPGPESNEAPIGVHVLAAAH
jgi:hypothetical protein